MMFVADTDNTQQPKPQASHYTTWNGQASKCSTGPSKEPTPNIHTTLMPPHGLQALASELGEN
jgi:hypothetical protein